MPVLDVIKGARIKRGKSNVILGNILCWYVKFDEGSIQYLKKGDDFIDPSECLFGIVNDK